MLLKRQIRQVTHLKRSFSFTLHDLAKINNTKEASHFIMTSIVEDLNRGAIKQRINPAVEAANVFIKREREREKGKHGEDDTHTLAKSDNDSTVNHDLLVSTKKEYRQLPDDSQFIEKHYEELVYYREKLGRDFGDFANVSELFMELSKFYPENDLGSGSGKGQGKEKGELTYEEIKDVPLIKFNKFIKDLKITLMLNGGHLFVLDLLIQNKSRFDDFEKKLNK